MKKNILKLVTGVFLTFALFVGCEQPNAGKEPENAGSSSTGVEATLKAAVKDVETTPQTQKEFEDLLKEVLTEYMSGIAGANSRMVSPTGTPLTDVNKILDELKSAIAEVKKIAEGKEKTFDFKKSVNIGEISYKNWIKLIFDLCDELYKASGEDAVSKEELLKTLDITEEQLNKYAEDLNKYSKIYNFYADADIKKDDSKFQAKMKLYASLGVTDFNAALAVFFKDGQFAESPVKAASAVVGYDYDVSLSSDDYEKMMAGENVSYSSSKIKTEVETLYKVAVCTADKKGGIITLNSNIKTNVSGSDSNSNIDISISIEDKDGKVTSFEYTYEEFVEMITSLVENQ